MKPNIDQCKVHSCGCSCNACLVVQDTWMNNKEIVDKEGQNSGCLKEVWKNVEECICYEFYSYDYNTVNRNHVLYIIVIVVIICVDNLLHFFEWQTTVWQAINISNGIVGRPWLSLAIIWEFTFLLPRG